MTEQVKDLTTCRITNGPRGLQLDWTIHQDLDGEDWRFLCFSFDLDALYGVMELIDCDGRAWTTDDKGETWTMTDEFRFSS